MKNLNYPNSDRQQFFAVTYVSREDIKHSFDEIYHKAIDMIDEANMDGFAGEVGDCLMRGGDYWMFIEEYGKDLFMDHHISLAKHDPTNFGFPVEYPKDCPHEEEYNTQWKLNGGCGRCPDFDTCKRDNGWCDYWDARGNEN